MKKACLLPSLLIVLLSGLNMAFGQNPNPQPNFSTQTLSANPSLYLNFNDYTTAFKDQVSQLTFGGIVPNVTFGGLPTPTMNSNNQAVVVQSVALSSGSLASVTLQFCGPPSPGCSLPVSGQTLTVVILSGTFPSLTIVNSFNVTLASNSSIQTFISGVAYSPVTVAAGEHIGTYTATGSNPGYGALVGGLSDWYLTGQATMPSGIHSYNSLSTATSDIEATVQTSSGTVLTRKPGFDSKQVNNTSAEFPYNGWNTAPNNSLGSIEWNVPWTMVLQVDRLNWNRTGTLVLASKGDIGSTSNNWWKLYLTIIGHYSQLCFARNGYGLAPSIGATRSAQNGICTGATFDAMPNGFNYNIAILDNGTGSSGIDSGGTASALGLYINGLQVGSTYIPGSAFTNSYQTGFGAATVSVSGGTGYAASTLFTSVGGGPNCAVTGSIASSGGVPITTSGGVVFTTNYGCTSVPQIVLTSPTGTGATITVGLGGQLMNSATSPLMVPGYVSNSGYYGIAGMTSTQASTYIDEFSIFQSNLTSAQIQSLYYQTKFYQEVLKAPPAIPYTLVYDNDGCKDTDDIYALALAIAAQKVGYIQLAGVVDTVGDGVSEAMYRQMLDQAGLSNVPMAVPSVFTLTSSGSCSAANINVFDASTPRTINSYPQAKTMYRQVFANNPTTPVFIMLGGSFRGVADLMQSPADSISPLTGSQLIARNAANGGAIYAQGLGANMTFTGDNSLADWTAGQYVVENNGALPIFWYGGGPQNTGPGVLSTRTAKDPLYLMANTLGADTRQGYDSLLTQSLISNLFAGGVHIAISGSGSGYAGQTPFTSTGGGADCVVNGLMLSTNGVPSSIISTGGFSSAAAAYEGLGDGCFTASNPPTIVLTNPTGTGAVLTATTTASPCGTVTITSSTSGSTSTATCANHFFLPMSLNAATSAAPVMQWFLNSLIDPAPDGAPRLQ